MTKAKRKCNAVLRRPFVLPMPEPSHEKRGKMQARQGACGFAAGSLLCVNDQGKTQMQRRIA
ncbi:MAG: hypothetical protein J6Z36_04140 [Clostridia bacterium]|nr:hypothetical protein [Clostridia bacterium]